MEESATGEAANMEVALLLGLTGQQAPEPLRTQAGVLRADAIAVLGMRDEHYRREIGAAAIAGQVWLRPADGLHRHEFSACGQPSRARSPVPAGCADRRRRVRSFVQFMSRRPVA